MATPAITLPDGPVLLDGGTGRELMRRGVVLSKSIWSATGLVAAPEVVKAIHADFIRAGADVIITNTYGTVRGALAEDGIEHRFADLVRLAGRLAREAAEAGGRRVIVAGSLPPMNGSYNPARVLPHGPLVALYRELAELLAPFCDVLLAETMCSAAEALAAVEGAAATGLPVWIAWTLHEDNSGRLRSGETITQAARAIAHLPVSGYLANCCTPESITAAAAELAGLGPCTGAYANAFVPIPSDYVLDTSIPAGEGMLPLRADLAPASYAVHARAWAAAGIRMIGGCCGTGPEHIAHLRDALG